MSRVLIAGVGHPDRGDDAVGWLVADRLRVLLAGVDGVEVVTSSADPSALLTLPGWDRAEHLVVIDAIVSGGPTGEVTVRHGEGALTAPAAGGTHDLGLASTLALARALGRLPGSVTVIGVEGARFGVGEPPSPQALAAVAQVTAELDEGVRGLVDRRTAG